MRPASIHLSIPGARRLFATAAALALAACASGPAETTDATAVAVAPGVAIRLPHRPDPGRRIEAVQTVTIRHRDSVFAFETRIAIGGGRFKMVALDALGRRALTLAWSDAGIDAEAAPWLPDGFEARNLLADMVMIYWPAEIVRGALSGAGARLEADRGGRTILSGEKEVIHIEFHPPRTRTWTGMTRYLNRGLGYSIEARSVELAP